MSHAFLPPSSATRWIACPGSAWAELEYVERLGHEPPPSAAAMHGTQAHALFAATLRCGADYLHIATLDPDDLAALKLAFDLARRIIGDRPFHVEQRLRALPDLHNVWGTGDVLAFHADGSLAIVIDLKFGTGVVEPHEPQLGIYALLGAREYGVTEAGVDAWIIQPRCPHLAGPARRHHYSRADLDLLETQFRKSAAKAEARDAPRRAGPWCRFCKAAEDCDTRQQAPNAVPPARSGFFR
jgi:hypothetical protein